MSAILAPTPANEILKESNYKKDGGSSDTSNGEFQLLNQNESKK